MPKDPSEFTQTIVNTLAKRAGQVCSNPDCRRPTSGGHTDKDKATVVGEAAHIHGQKPGSARYDQSMTPAERGDIENGIWLCSVCHKKIDTDEKKYPARILIKWKLEHEGSVLENKQSHLATEVLHKPILDLLPSVGYNGGPSGHFHTFTIKNLSATETAINCTYKIVGFGYEWIPEIIPASGITLEPKDVKDVIYQISTVDPAREEPPVIPELQFVIEYENTEGQKFISKRMLEQIPVRSKMYNELRIGQYSPPVLKEVNGLRIRFRELLGYMGGGRDGLFDVSYEGKQQAVKISITDTLLSTWGFGSDTAIKAALSELGERKIQQMAEEGSIQDYQFQTYSFPQEYQGGYEGYKKAKESLN